MSDKTLTLICCSVQITAWCPPVTDSGAWSNWSGRVLSTGCVERSTTHIDRMGEWWRRWICFASITIHKLIQNNLHDESTERTTTTSSSTDQADLLDTPWHNRKWRRATRQWAPPDRTHKFGMLWVAENQLRYPQTSTKSTLFHEDVD